MGGTNTRLPQQWVVSAGVVPTVTFAELPAPQQVSRKAAERSATLHTHALIDSQSFSVILYRWAFESLQAIPADYNGEFAEEIAALRDALPGKITEQEQIDAERAASLTQQQKPKPPQTFNYGGGTDTGPGSGHGLREDYGDPEDLYEDGDYNDLDEAWDEWEEGW